MNEKLDFFIVITTFNRPKMLYSLLDQIEKQTKDKKIKILLLNDCSTEKYELSNYDLIKINFCPNKGKKLFWEIIDLSFKVCKKIDSKYFVYLQDDLKLCDNFFNELKNKYENIKDDKKISLEFRTDNRTERPNWNNFEPQIVGDYIHSNWVELDFICEKKFFDVLEYKINEISKNRWDNNPNLSSGVGQQLTQRLLNLGFNMYHTKKSFVEHGDHQSKMNEEERKITKLIS
jgi:glycosyltransferase involved in cell wall biosynthesis